MSLKLNSKYVKGFVTDEEIYSYQEKITKAHNDLHGKTGAGNDFTGWVDLPVDYDKDEFARINYVRMRQIDYRAHSLYEIACRQKFPQRPHYVVFDQATEPIIHDEPINVPEVDETPETTTPEQDAYIC